MKTLTYSEAAELRSGLLGVINDANAIREQKIQAEDYYYGLKEGWDCDVGRVRRFILYRR